MLLWTNYFIQRPSSKQVRVPRVQEARVSACANKGNGLLVLYCVQGAVSQPTITPSLSSAIINLGSDVLSYIICVQQKRDNKNYSHFVQWFLMVAWLQMNISASKKSKNLHFSSCLVIEFIVEINCFINSMMVYRKIVSLVNEKWRKWRIMSRIFGF